MPYVKKEVQEELDAGRVPREVGEVNYLATQAAIRFIDARHHAYGEKVNYALISSAISALEEAAAEMRRRLLAPYENLKIEENGDVYPEWLQSAVNGAEWVGYVGEHPGYAEDKLRHTSAEPRYDWWDDQCQINPVSRGA